VTGLTFGVDTIIDLCSDEPIGVDGYIFEASSAEDGADWGNPDAVITEIQSQLLDGSLGKITSFENRTATIPLRIYAINMDALADAEAVLMGEVYRDGWNQLVWTPPAASVSTVFDVVYADLQFKLDDLTEQRCIRNYTLTLTCLPRPRSADLVTVKSLPIIPPDPSQTVINDGSSTSGWSTTGKAEVRRNLITNPSFETGTAGWALGTGTQSWQLFPTGGVAGSSGDYMFSPSAAQGATQSFVYGPYFPVVAGSKYAVQMMLLGAQATKGFLLLFLNAGGQTIGVAGGDGITSGVYTAPTGAVRARVEPYIKPPAGSWVSYWWNLDSVLVEKAAAVGSYFDGDFPASGGTTYRWLGQRGNSPSVALQAATPSVVDGAVTVKVFGASADLSLAESVDATAETFIGVTGTVTYSEGSTPSGTDFKLVADGKTYPAAYLQYDSSGAFTAYFHVSASVSSIKLVATAQGSPGFTTLAISEVLTSDALPVLGSARQQYRHLDVYGSARTQASLRVETSDADLGAETLVFTAPPQSSGFQPPLRTHRVGGPTPTTSATAVSGATNALATSQAAADHWTISTAIIQPATYELYAYLSVASATTVTLSWQASGTAAGTPTVTGSRTMTLAAGWQFVSIGSIELPAARAYAGSSDDVQLYLWASAAGVTIDDAYLFDGDGHLDIIGTSGCSLLLLNSASIDEPEATAWVGKAAGSDGGDPDVDTDVVYAGNRAQAWEQLQFAPPSANVFMVTPGTTQAQMSMTYPPRWGHHAGQVPAA
jgi:hypothetical protein